MSKDYCEEIQKVQYEILGAFEGQRTSKAVTAKEFIKPYTDRLCELMAEEYKKGYIDGGIAELTKESE